MSGPIENDDTSRFAAAIEPYLDRDILELVLRIDSPGGSLAEGLRLGRAISQLPFRSRIDVGSDDGPKICASACVFIYLGADYRFLSEEARIGVHQFSTPSEMASDEAMSISQTVSASIINHIREMRADPAFFSLMVSARSEQIYWVPRETLEKLKVVTYGIYDETAEYRNANGSIVLHLTQTSQYGTNSMALLCGEEGMVTFVDLNEPEIARVEQLELFIDGTTYALPEAEIISREGARLKALALLPHEIATRLQTAREVGARASSPSAGIFFGFEEGVEDPKIGETAQGCLASLQARQAKMSVVHGVDFTGGDLTSNGYRDVAFSECQQLCIRDRRCVAVSYVQSQRWCWPKGSIVSAEQRLGISSAYFE